MYCCAAYPEKTEASTCFVVEPYLKDTGITGLASAMAVARRRPMWGIWAWRAWHLPGRWTDGGRRSTVTRWTRRRAAPSYYLTWSNLFWNKPFLNEKRVRKTRCSPKWIFYTITTDTCELSGIPDAKIVCQQKWPQGMTKSLCLADITIMKTHMENMITWCTVWMWFRFWNKKNLKLFMKKITCLHARF